MDRRTNGRTDTSEEATETDREVVYKKDTTMYTRKYERVCV